MRLNKRLWLESTWLGHVPEYNFVWFIMKLTILVNNNLLPGNFLKELVTFLAEFFTEIHC